jgi:tetratricopeptide (TPR) repeat protein
LLALARAGQAAALPQALRRHQQALALQRRLHRGPSDAVARALNNLAGVRDLQGRGAAAARLYAASLKIWRAILPPGDARLAYGALNTGAMMLESGVADRAEPLLREALEIREAAFAAQPQHPDRRLAADWLISCLLRRAQAGENRGLREMQARQLCDRYGFDFDERQKFAARYPYTPPAP